MSKDSKDHKYCKACQALCKLNGALEQLLVCHKTKQSKEDKEAVADVRKRQQIQQGEIS